MDYQYEKTCQIAFNLIKGIGPRVYKMIADEFDAVSEIFDLNETDIVTFVTKKDIQESILNKTTFAKAKEVYAFCEKNDIEILFYKDKKFPKRLNFHAGLPCILYYKGNADLNAKRIVSIVGTRDPSHRGKIKCEKIVKELKKHECLIVSGLAYGVDITAHKSALKEGLNTIGVMANGHEKIYPPDHEKTSKKMISQGGLLTEIIPHTKLIKEMFPMRNRIVAAMCDAVIVVESATRGGSLITAGYANEYTKDVFAVPGRPEDEASKGCNLLIKSHRAHMYEFLKDLEYITRWDAKKVAIQTSLFSALSDEENEIVMLIKKLGEVHVDFIHKELKKPSGSLSALLLQLELSGIIKSIPGKQYICV